MLAGIAMPGAKVEVSELCGLRTQDAFEDHIRVFGKGKKEREVGISP